MALRVLVVPDKFKGTLTARSAVELIATGWREARPDDDLELLPMSDGGDGFGEVFAHLLSLDPRAGVTVDAAHRSRTATWWWNDQSQTAVLESAQVIGLALLPPQQYHPFALDTAGLGVLLRTVAALGAKQCLMGIGGSATNDAGFGMARSLGWTFLDQAGAPLARWTDLVHLARVQAPERDEGIPEITVAVDVQNPLLGPAGASRIYGPQKGLRPQDFALAEDCLSRLAAVVRQDLGLEIANEPGTGAAGGLGFGLRAFLRARLESGFGLFARYAQLEERIAAADLVITGEGAIDASTLMGKGVGEVARLCQKHAVPCLGLAGTLRPLGAAEAKLNPFTLVCGIVPQLTVPEQALAEPEVWLRRLAAAAGRQWLSIQPS